MILSIILFLIAIILLASIINGAPFLPTKEANINKMVELANVQTGMRIVDLGAGDGRIVIAFAKAGTEAHGYEINPILVLWGILKIRRERLQGRAFMHWRSFWGVDLSKFDVVTVFGITHIMNRLENKLQKELKPGAKVLSNIFQLPNWTGTKEQGINIYQK